MSDAQADPPGTVVQPGPTAQPGTAGRAGPIRRLDGSPIRVLVVDD